MRANGAFVAPQKGWARLLQRPSIDGNSLPSTVLSATILSQSIWPVVPFHASTRPSFSRTYRKSMSSVVGKKTFGGIGVVGGTFVVVDDSVGVLKVVATIAVAEMMQRTSALIQDICAARKMSECTVRLAQVKLFLRTVPGSGVGA